MTETRRDLPAGTFGVWLEDQHPDGTVTRAAGAYTQDDMEAAWNAGYDAGHAEATNYLASGGSFK